MKKGSRDWEVLDELQANQPRIVTGGFTVQEFALRYEITANMARKRIGDLLKGKKIRLLGKRQAHAGGASQLAYEVVKEKGKRL